MVIGLGLTLTLSQQANSQGQIKPNAGAFPSCFVSAAFLRTFQAHLSTRREPATTQADPPQREQAVCAVAGAASIANTSRTRLG